MRRASSCLLVLLCASLLGACVDRTDIAPEGVLRIGQTGEPDSLDPQLAVTGPAIVIVNDLFEGLLTLDAEGRVVPGAAEGYTVSADGLTYTFTLRSPLRWSDGEPLTSADFVYAFRRMADPATAATALSVNIDLLRNGAAVVAGELPPTALGVAAPDERTVRIELEHPAPYFPSIIATGSYGPVPRRLIEQYGRDWTRPGVLVSNGAFRLVAWAPNDYVRLERNPWFHAADTVALDAVVYRPVIDLNTGFRQFQAGELDALTNFPPEKLALLRETMPQAVRLAPSLGLTAYLINHRLPKFQDVRVRHALSLAIDRERITNKVLATDDAPAWGLVPDGIPGYFAALGPPDGLDTPSERAAMARRLLAEAGYDEQHPLEVELLFHNSAEHRKVAIAAASMWQEVGVRASLRSGDRQVVDAAARRGEFELVRLALFAGYVDPTGFFRAVLADSPVNGMGYRNAELERLYAEAAATADVGRRADLLREAETVAVRDQALVPLYFLMSRRLVADRVIGWPEDNLTALRPARYLSLTSQ